MSDINLLPQDDRAREQKERAAASRIAQEHRVELTKGGSLPKVKSASGNLLQRLFARTPKEPSKSPKADMGAPEAVLGSVGAAGALPKPLPVARVTPRPPLWKRLWPRGLKGTLHPSAPVPHVKTESSGQEKGVLQRYLFFTRKSAEELDSGKPLVTSLLPKEYLRSGRHTFAYIELGFALLVSGGLIALLFWSLLGYETAVSVQLDSAKKEVSIAEGRIAALDREKSEALLLQRKLKAAAALLDSHVLWTNGLRFLESKTIPDVQYLSLVVNSVTRKMALKAQAKTFSAIAEQLLILQNASEIKSVSITRAEAQGEQLLIGFEIGLELFPEVIQNRVTSAQ